MTTAEIIQAIRNEIERLEEEARKVRVSKEKSLNEKIGADGKVNLCRDILSFLSTLEESEIPNDLEEAKEAYCEEHNDECFDAIGSKCPHIRNAFIAGAKWQEKKDQDTIKLAEDHAFLAGADWQREQMMKDAVPFYEILKAVPPGPERENVRIIIVKEDEK